ncbi:hypothetical protein F7H86_01420 [Novacetimonas hansenii]
MRFVALLFSQVSVFSSRTSLLLFFIFIPPLIDSPSKLKKVKKFMTMSSVMTAIGIEPATPPKANLVDRIQRRTTEDKSREDDDLG